MRQSWLFFSTCVGLLALSACGSSTDSTGESVPPVTAGAGGNGFGGGSAGGPMAIVGGSAGLGGKAATGGAGKGSKGGAGGAAGGKGGAAGTGAGGGAAGTGGQPADPCAGKSCGAPCDACVPGQPCSDIATFCNQVGQCTPQQPACGAVQCKQASDCPPLGVPCQLCPDGSQSCPQVACEMGQCVASLAPCPTGPVCKTDLDCPQVDAPCQACPDGSAACPSDHCVGGQCVFSMPTCGASCAPQQAQGVGGCDLFLGFIWDGSTCPGIGGCSCAGPDCPSLYQDQNTCLKEHANCPKADPCLGLPCGAPCSTCPPGAPCAFESCDSNGQCVVGPATCGSQCQLASDCPLPGGPPCQLCPDGSEACLTAQCLGGQCSYQQAVCAQPVCKTDQDCPLPGVPCQLCPDGSSACPSTLCIAGTCSISIPSCPDPNPCAPQDATSIGGCGTFVGFAWNGTGCAQIKCGCSGTACGSLYPDGDSCLKAHAVCSGI